MALDYKSSLARYGKYLQVVRSHSLWGASFWVIMTLLLLIMMVIFALKPTLTTIASLMGQIKQREEIAKILDQKINNLRMAESMLKENRKNIELLDEGLPQNPQWVEFESKINNIAVSSGVALTAVSYTLVPVTGNSLPPTDPGKDTLLGEVDSIKISLKGNGDYNQDKNMISAIENLRRLVVVLEFSIQKDKDGVISTSVEAVLPYYPEGVNL